jgi:hypothetical protein
MKAIASVIVAIAASGQALPDARSLLDRHLRESGTLAANRTAIQVTIGRFTASGISGKLTRYVDGEGRYYQVMEAREIGKIEAGNNGDIEWERSTANGPRVLRVSSSPGSLLRVDAGDVSYWVGAAVEAKTVREDSVDGRPCWLVEIKTGTYAQPSRLCLDRQTGLLSRVESVSGDGAVVMKLWDYRPVGSWKIAHRYETISGAQTMRVDLDEIRPAAEVTSSIFDVSEDILELARKREQNVEIKEADEDPGRPRLKRKKK